MNTSIKIKNNNNNTGFFLKKEKTTGQKENYRPKRKLQANITGEYRYKNPQPKFNKQNSATHQKAHTPSSTWVYSRDARILEYRQIKQCDIPYQQIER